MPFGQIRGRQGSVAIPSMGAVVGRFDGAGGYWILKRRERQEQGEPVAYHFHAVLTYLNHLLYDDDRFVKETTIKVGSELFRVEPIDGQRMVLLGRTLQSEGVNLWPIELI